MTALHILLPFLFAVGTAVWLHRRDAVAMAGHPLDPYIDGLPALMTAFGFWLLLAGTGRPLFSGLCMAGAAGLLFVLNRLKQRHFHEPIVFLDFALVNQVLRYSRFYVPYLFPKPVLAGGVVVGLGLAGIWREETPVACGWQCGSLGLAVGSAAGVWYWLKGLLATTGRPRALALLTRLAPSLNAKADFARLGLFASMLGHGLWHVHVRGSEGQPGIRPSGPDRPASPPLHLREPAPHIVLVQAESFCDIRRHLPEVDAGVLDGFDRLRKSSLSGRFLVTTYGAYTMRTEFSVLTGLGAQELGTDAFHPYFTAARQPVVSLAWTLRSAGYRSLCLHPFSCQFFRRNQVIPHLGFEAFETLPRFAGLARSGPYVSDAVLGQRILDRLAASDQPTLAFAITIEAHGPWTPDRFRDDPAGGPAGRDPLSVYLWHLGHMDALFSHLAEGLSQLGRPAILCGYGDHVPGLPGVGRPELSQPTATDWFLWDSRQPVTAAPRDLRPEDLSTVLTQTITSAG